MSSKQTSPSISDLGVRGLLILVPIPPLLSHFGVPTIWVFMSAAASTAILAEWIRRATKQLANRAGPSIGGLLNVSFGSIAEITLALFVLAKGDVATVQAQITGSILGTSLLGLGLAIFVGGVFHQKTLFQRERAGLLSTLLILSTIALILPAVFDYVGVQSSRLRAVRISEEQLSLGASVVMLLLYFGNLFYTLVTHRDVFSIEDRGEKPEWSMGLAIAVLIGGTICTAVEAELISSALVATARDLHISRYFLGIVVLALTGTSADLFAAVAFAAKNRMGLVMSICIGSAIQMALVVAPLLVLASWFMGRPMNLVFSDPLELFALGSTAIIVRAIAGDGETTWFEGLMLLGVYVLFSIAFLLIGGAEFA